MKKGIIVLLITVLAAGMVFAGTLTGSAGISFGFDLDKKDWGFENSAESTFKFTFNLDTTDVAINTHDTDIWAEITAEAYGDINYDSRKTYSDDVSPVRILALWPGLYDIDFGITAANIHIGEVTIGILGAGGAYDYATDYHTDTKGNPINDVVISNVVAESGYKLVAPGFTVSYDGWAGGFGAAGNTENKTYTVLGHAQTKEFTFVEGLTAQAAVLAYLSEGRNVVSASAQAAYDADKLSADVAGDFQFVEKSFEFEVAANAEYDFVTLNVYATDGKLSKDVLMYEDDNVKVKLDAKLAAENTFEGDVPVTVSASVDATNVLVKGKETEIKASVSATVEEKVTVKAEAAYKITAKTLAPTLTVTYTHDMFEATAKLAMGFDFGAEEALTSLKPELSVKSTELVENATLALTWKGSQFAGETKTNGAITASATIEF